MKRNPTAIVIGALVIILFCLPLFVFQVRQSEAVLITTFGRPGKTYNEPGAYFKLPWPIQQTHTFDQRIQNLEDKLEPVLTSDQKQLLATVYIGWKINDPQIFLPSFRDGSVEQAQYRLQDLVSATKKIVMSKHPLSDFVSSDASQVKFEPVEAEMLNSIQAQLRTNNYGITVQFVGIKRLGFPESVTGEVLTLMTREREKLSTATIADAESQGQKIRTQADNESLSIIAVATAEASKINGQGQAEAAKTFEEFQKDPEFANFQQEMKALDQVLKQSTLILGPETAPFNWLERGVSTNSLRLK